jgi:transcriptional regulator with XRE-family HTH domain
LTCAEFAEKIKVRKVELVGLGHGELNADWAALRMIARELGLPLDALMELAEEPSRGEGGEEWWRWSREAQGRGTLTDTSKKLCRWPN